MRRFSFSWAERVATRRITVRLNENRKDQGIVVSYILFAIAGLWMADGLVLLVAPDRVVGLLKQALAVSPTLLKWGGIAGALGVVLLIGAENLPYQPLWGLVALAMIAKGLFLFVAPDPWRRAVVNWCLEREVVDYRFWGLGLCALSILLLDALGWLREK